VIRDGLFVYLNLLHEIFFWLFKMGDFGCRPAYGRRMFYALGFLPRPEQVFYRIFYRE
jgi:hypothetical protein